MNGNKKRILIGIPAYDSKIYCLGMVSIFHNMRKLEEMGHFVTYYCQMKGAYLDLNRNKIIKEFMDGGFTDLIFVDSDLAFDADAMAKLIKYDTQVVGGVYPYREMDDKGYPIDVKLDDNKVPIGDRSNGLIECYHVPTGMLRIRRDAIEKLSSRFPHLIDDKNVLQLFATGQNIMYEQAIARLLNEIKRLNGMEYDNELTVDVNNPFKDCDNRYFGEDVYFCKICNEVGIKVYCDPTVTFIHFGTLPKKGRYADCLCNHGESDV